jgi:hypothetical protein
MTPVLGTNVMRLLRVVIDFIDDLMTDHGTGKWSHTKFWANVAYGIASWSVIWLTLQGSLPTEVFVGYLLIVSGHTAVSKWLSNKDRYNHRGDYDV